MKYFSIDTVINKELFNRFLDFCNSNSGDEWTVSLSTVGGQSTVAANILYMLNERSDNVTLVCQEAYSAAFDIFYRAKCKKCICGTAKGMTHLHSIDMRVNERLQPIYDEDKCIVKAWKQSRKGEYKFAKKLMTKKEFKDFKRGYEVYFTFKRMVEIFPGAEII